MNNTTVSREHYNDSYSYYDIQDDILLPFTYPIYFQVAVYVLYNAVFITAIGGNSLVIYVVFKTPRMKTVTNLLISNLAVGDLLLSTTLPFTYISILYQHWPFGSILCHLISPLQAIFIFVSAYTLVALSVDRYYAIIYPLKMRISVDNVWFLVCMIWIIAFITVLPVFFVTEQIIDEESGRWLCEEQWDQSSVNVKMGYGLVLMGMQYFLPVGVLFFTYLRIILHILESQKEGLEIDNRELRLNRARRKTIIMTLTVTGMYTLCWFPLNTLMLYMDFKKDKDEIHNLEYIFFCCHWLAMAHTSYNPIIYGFINERFRGAFGGIFCCWTDGSAAMDGGGGDIIDRRSVRRSAFF